MVTTADLLPGRIVWADLGGTVGREQAGRRPCLVVGSRDLLEVADTLVVVVPCTSKDRSWRNHIPLTGDTGLAVATFAVTEQPRTISRQRLGRAIGYVDDGCLTEIMRWVHTWLHPAA